MHPGQTASHPLYVAIGPSEGYHRGAPGRNLKYLDYFCCVNPDNNTNKRHSSRLSHRILMEFFCRHQVDSCITADLLGRLLVGVGMLLLLGAPSLSLSTAAPASRTDVPFVGALCFFRVGHLFPSCFSHRVQSKITAVKGTNPRARCANRGTRFDQACGIQYQQQSRYSPTAVVASRTENTAKFKTLASSWAARRASTGTTGVHRENTAGA